MDNELRLIGRTSELFTEDLTSHESSIASAVRDSKILVVGGAGSIGGAVVKELFRRNPRILHVVDLSENSLTELVRDIRSSIGYVEGEFKTFCLDCGSTEFESFMEDQSGYDYILNFSAMKHVRSERDPYTLMRMIQVNILNAEKLLSYAVKAKAAKYFCVSTDKATNPVNMMGASKRIMEMFMMRAGEHIPVSSARFANVAFSNGSLLDGFNQRLRKLQPIAAPFDVKRYFVTEREAAVLSLLSAFVGDNRDIFFPKLSHKLPMATFSEIAVRYLALVGYEPSLCDSEEEARGKIAALPGEKKWPCYFFKTDTTGEKDFEEFFADKDMVDWERFHDIGVVKNDAPCDNKQLEHFLSTINRYLARKQWTKEDLVNLFTDTLGFFDHKETFKSLDDRM